MREERRRNSEGSNGAILGLLVGGIAILGMKVYSRLESASRLMVVEDIDEYHNLARQAYQLALAKNNPEAKRKILVSLNKLTELKVHAKTFCGNETNRKKSMIVAEARLEVMKIEAILDSLK